MQIQGYLDAISHPSFLEAVRGGRHGRVGLTFVTWTDARRQDQTVPWQVIEDEAGTRRILPGRARRTEAGPRLDLYQRRDRLLRQAAADQRLQRGAEGDRHLRRRRQQRWPPGNRGARCRSGSGHHHQRVADHRGRARPGEILSGERHRRSQTPLSWSRAIARHSARQSYANCWLRSPESHPLKRSNAGSSQFAITGAATLTPLNAGMTSRANHSSCSSASDSGTPTERLTVTRSRPG